MKRILIAMTALLTIALSAKAMSYEQARQQALFLTDKMAYELNLTEEQYEAAYEVNLDYLMSVNTQADLYGVYWTQRNLDLSYILLDWQYSAYLAATYFYRPLYWERGYWHFGIYARYPYRDYFYFGRPHFYTVYRGGHSWRMNGGRSWYHGRDFGHRGGRGVHGNIGGMRDRFDRGDYGRGHGGRGGNNPGFGNRGGNNRGGNNPEIANRGGRGGDNGTFNRDRIRSDRQLGTNSPRTIGGDRVGRGSRNFGSESRSFGSESRSITRQALTQLWLIQQPFTQLWLIEPRQQPLAQLRIFQQSFTQLRQFKPWQCSLTEFQRSLQRRPFLRWQQPWRWIQRWRQPWWWQLRRRS